MRTTVLNPHLFPSPNRPDLPDTTGFQRRERQEVGKRAAKCVVDGDPVKQRHERGDIHQPLQGLPARAHRSHR